ncbi:MAG: outer membrane beta-barrel protein [Candidatus Aminicenantes bacterium]|nr:outer membrane beta-barrel protein [Candidatus Aminicenantes bacterium]
MTKIILMILLMMALLNISLVSKEESTHWIFLNSGVSFPKPTAGTQSLSIGAGFGFKLSPKFGLQGSLDYMSYKDKNIRANSASLFSLLIDAKYRFNNKPLTPYLLGSAGLNLVHRTDPYFSPIFPEISEKDKIMCAVFGGGVGLNLKLSKKINLYVEQRILLLLFEEKKNKIGAGVYFPMRFGVLLDL